METEKNKVFGPYSVIRQVGSSYFTSGHIGVDPITKKVSEAVAAQTLKTLDNLQATLAEAGLSLDNVIKTTVYLVDMADFEKVNEAYATRFTPPYPARSTVAVKELPHVAANGQVKVEIEAVAVKGGVA